MTVRACAAACLVVLLAAASLACALYFWRTQPHSLVFNSDILVVVDFFHDLSNFPAVVSQFQFPRVPSFIPDMLALTAVATAFPDFHLAMFAYAVVQSFGFLIAATWLVSVCTDKSAIRCGIAVAMLTVVSLLLNGAFAPLFGLTYVSFFTPVMHFGSLILSLIAVGIFLKLLEKPEKLRWTLLALISTAALASDKIFILTFIAPALITALVLSRQGRIKISFVLGLGALLGLSLVAANLLLKLVLLQPGLPIVKVLVRAVGFVRVFAAQIAEYPITYLCLLIGPLVFVAASPWLVRFPSRLKATWLLGGLAMLATLGFTAAFFADFNSLRYWPAMIGWPIILAASVLVLTVPHGLFRVIGPLAAAVVVAFCGFEIHAASLAGLRAWHDPLADCLMREQQDLGLREGLADFWLARPAVISSNWRLQIEQLLRGRYTVWGNNAYWVSHSRLRIGEPPVFNYIVLGPLNPYFEVTEYFGAPARTAECAGHQIWIYDRPLDPLKDARN